MDRITKAALITLVVVGVGMVGAVLWPVDSCGPAVTQAFRTVHEAPEVERSGLTDYASLARELTPDSTTVTRSGIDVDAIFAAGRAREDRACRDAGRSRLLRTVGIGAGLVVVVGASWWIIRRPNAQNPPA